MILSFYNWLCKFLRKPLSPYIDYPNDYCIPLPGVAHNATLYCFPIEADYQKMQAVCDTRFNAVLQNQNCRIFPLTNHLMLTVSDIQYGYTTDTSYEKVGYVPEKALQFFMPVVQCRKNLWGKWVAQEMLFAVPYIFVDTSFTLVTGRESIGFPKAMANINISAQKDNFEINAYGFQTFDKMNPQFVGYHPLTTIQRIDNEQDIADSTTIWQEGEAAWAAVKDTFERIPSAERQYKFGITFLLDEIRDLLKAQIPMVFLKQFRDVKEAQKACYQSITRSNGVLEKFHSGWFLKGDYQINIADFASFPIKQDLGLPDTIIVKNAFWIKADLLFQCGEEI